MLRNLRVRNFKSIGPTIDIELAPLTIITGSNSSGKSSLLQCLLLLLQTLRNSSPDRQFVLNGPLTQLGDYDDILHSGAGDRSIAVGLRVVPPPTSADEDSPQALMRKARTPTSVDVEWSLTDKPLRSDISKGESKTFPTLQQVRIVGSYESGDIVDPTTLVIKRHAWSVERRQAVEGYESSVPDDNLNSLAWSVSSDPKFGQDVRGAKFDHCLPAELTRRVDIQQLVARHILETLSKSRQSSDTAPGEWEVFEDLWALFNDRVLTPLSLDARELEGSREVSVIRNWILGKPLVIRRRFWAQAQQEADGILDAYSRSSEPTPWLFSGPIPAPWSRSVSAVRESVLKLRYLGPLRAQPAPIYPVATTLGAEDVGPIGEWTASVLDTYRNKVVSYPDPAHIPFSSANVRTQSEPLILAVKTWMQYLGVANSITTTDRGSLGHELTVSSDSSHREVPLTHVGVGVSQCLPVVVSLLLAPDDSMTLLEQPELHLHPAVQSRLADFILGMALMGRQCLVETHSEYMVNRLRLRIAEAEGSYMRDQVALYFAENERGHSEFSRVEVNEYGSIAHWPRGFFDDTQDDIERLLNASHKKRTVNVRRS